MNLLEIPNYDVKEVIGEGGMAIVYRAMHQLLKQERAIKVMFSSLSNEPAFEKNFLHEGQIVASLNHPHIVKIHDIGRCDEGYFMTMEYLTGGNLGDKLKKNPLPLTQAITIIQQIGSALHYAHQQGLIHRDIKPNNIMFSDKGDAILTDFGISKLQDTESDLTRYGYSVLGTPRYMSPEQTTAEPLDRRSDIYSLALVFYEILIGQPGIKTKTTVSIIREHVLSPPPSFSANYAYFQPILNKALAKDPKDRYATVKEFVNAITIQKPEKEDETVIISTLDKPEINAFSTPEKDLNFHPNKTTNKKKNYKPIIYLSLLLFLVSSASWLLTQSSLFSNQGHKKNNSPSVSNPNEVIINNTSITQKKLQALSSSIIQPQEVDEKTQIPEQLDITPSTKNEDNIVSSSVPSCNINSVNIKEGIDCFKKNNPDGSKTIFNNIIKQTNNYKNFNQYIEAYLYLSLISIENNDNISATDYIKHIYFMDPKFNLNTYDISKKKYINIFNQSKNTQRKEGDIETDSIINAKFIRVGNGFWIGEKEISQKQWHSIMLTEENVSDADHPIRETTWEKANDFSTKVKKRLCSVREWTTALKTIKESSYNNAIIGESGWSPSSINTGEKGSTGITNLIGNVMEFTINKNKPAYIGLYWNQMSDNLTIDDIKKSNKKASLKTKSFNIGIRLCQ
jgi:serine/threonine protein kinase